MYANEICQGTAIRTGQERRSGAASKMWERAAAETGLQAEGIPWKTAWRSRSKRRGRNRTMRTGEPHGTSAADHDFRYWAPRPKTQGLPTASRKRAGSCQARGVGDLWANAQTGPILHGEKGGEEKPAFYSMASLLCHFGEWISIPTRDPIETPGHSLLALHSYILTGKPPTE